MPNRLADAISPYLRAHSDNPVDWFPWSEDAFAEAEHRDVPLLISIGYATCHWCHVMARESFSDPELAAYLNERFVAIKVDREEHPDVDAAYLAAASAFTQNLGWPLTVFTTPEGRTFFAGTYFPPKAMRGQPSFREVLDAVFEAWTDRRDQVEQTSALVTDALAAAREAPAEQLPSASALNEAAEALVAHEDQLYGGFGAAPKFPVSPVLGFLLERPAGRESAERTLEKMAASPLRDTVDGGFFRYATQRDWSEPHYERMLYDNALLLMNYTDLALSTDAESSDRFDAGETAAGIARFLATTLRLPNGAFASAQDSESTIDGARVEGVYYTLGPEERAELTAPPLDTKVLTGWNGLAIGALARAGFALGRSDWLDSASTAADALLALHRKPDGTLARTSREGRLSTAAATLEDYGMLADGLLQLALAIGDARFAVVARELLDQALSSAPVGRGGDGIPFGVPGGGDPVLKGRGIGTAADPAEGAYPSGITATASAAHTLYLLTGERRYEDAALAAMRTVAAAALTSPISFGAALRLMGALEREPVQLVVVLPDASHSDALMAEVARRGSRGSDVATVLPQARAAAFAAAGFELFEARTARDGLPTAYLCRDFLCRLPTTDPAELASSLVE